MPRGHLNERYVQKAAVEWLATHYKETLKHKAVLPTMEKFVRKNSQYGSGRADGLVATLLADNSIFVASLEAKSARTWKDIRGDNLQLELAIELLLIGLVACVVGSFLGNILGFHDWAFAVLCLIVSVAIYGLFLFKRKRHKYRRISVVHQLKRYPADEQWIALSTDIYNRVKREKFHDNFLQTCERDGIGLLQVSSSQKVTLVTSAKKKPLPKGLDCFLSCYSKEDFIRKELQAIYAGSLIVNEPVELDIVPKPEYVNEIVEAEQDTPDLVL